MRGVWAWTPWRLARVAAAAVFRGIPAVTAVWSSGRLALLALLGGIGMLSVSVAQLTHAREHRQIALLVLG